MNKLKRYFFAAVGKELHIDVPLSNVAIDYRPEGMIADMIAPVVTVPNMSGQIPIFDRGDLLRVEDDLRAPGTEANRVSRNVSSDSFICTNYALQDGVTVEDRYNADPIYVQKLFTGGTEFLKTKLALSWERRVARMVTSGTNVGSFAAVSSAWTDLTNSDPLSDVLTGMDNVQDANGLRANKAIFGERAWRYFRRNTEIRNLINGNNNGGGFVSLAQVEALLELDKILVGRAYENTVAEGLGESLSQIWDDNVLVYYAPDNPSIITPSFMYSFRVKSGGIPNMQVERHPYNGKTKQWDYELGYYQTEKITGQGYGFLVGDVTLST